MNTNSGTPRIYVWMGLPTTTSLDDHVLVILQNYIIVFVEVEHGYGRQLRGHTARPWHGPRIHRVDQSLDDGVVRRVQMIGQGERTFSPAIVGLVTRRRHYPIIPTDIAEVHVKRMSSAVVPLLAAVSFAGTRAVPPAVLPRRSFRPGQRRLSTSPTVVRVR